MSQDHTLKFQAFLLNSPDGCHPSGEQGDGMRQVLGGTMEIVVKLVVIKYSYGCHYAYGQ